MILMEQDQLYTNTNWTILRCGLKLCVFHHGIVDVSDDAFFFSSNMPLNNSAVMLYKSLTLIFNVPTVCLHRLLIMVEDIRAP